MIAALLAPFGLSVLLWWAAPRVLRACRPRVAATMLGAASLIAALSTGLTLCAVAALGLTEIPALARVGGWSNRLLTSRAPVPIVVGVGCGLLAAVLLAASVRHAVRALLAILAAARTGRELGPEAGGLVIAADEAPYAYAVPGLRGRTIVSRGLLRRLDATERRAVLAHEEAHRRHRHFVYVQAAELAAAANPLLRPASRAVRLAVESWADDEAAAVLGDRAAVARTLARVGLMGRGAPAGPTSAGPPSLAAADSDLWVRVQALLVDAPRRRTRAVVLALVSATLIGSGSAGAIAIDAHADFESAQAAHLTGR